MTPAVFQRGRKWRAAARLFLLAGLVVFLFSVFFYTSVFWSAGKGVALHSGRLSLILGSSTGEPAGMTCYRTEPLMMFMPLFVARGIVFVAVPLWVVGVPGAILGAADLIRIIRARRDRCFACGYSLKGLGAGACCPECGLTPDAKLLTPADYARAFGRGAMRRGLAALGIVGAVAALAWFLSGFYGPAFRPSTRTAMAIRHGQFELHTTRARVPEDDARPEDDSVLATVRRMLQDADIPGRSNPFERHRGQDPPPFVPLPAWAPPPSSMGCPPLDPIGWALGSRFEWGPDAQRRTVVVPLWWVAPPLLACAIPMVRRRWIGSRRNTGRKPGATVSSSGETP